MDYAQLVAVLKETGAPPQIYVFDYPFSVRYHAADAGEDGKPGSTTFVYGSAKVFRTPHTELGAGWLSRTKVAVRHFLKTLLGMVLPSSQALHWWPRMACPVRRPCIGGRAGR